MNKDIMFSTGNNVWSTPQWLFDKLNDEFHFTIDICADKNNKKCDKYIDEWVDVLKVDIDPSEIIWCNPPYSNLTQTKIVRKCYEHSLKGGIAVLLIPARTDTERFHNYILGKASIRFIKGRLKFGDSKNSAPFPSMIVIYDNKEPTITSFKIN